MSCAYLTERLSLQDFQSCCVLRPTLSSIVEGQTYIMSFLTSRLKLPSPANFQILYKSFL